MKVRKPSAALIIATGALVLSATGGAVAATDALSNGSVTTASIKTGAVTNSKIHPGAVSGNKLTGNLRSELQAKSIPGPVGPAGPAGAQGAAGRDGTDGHVGATGAQGAQGPAGDSYLSGAYYATAAYDSGDTNGGAIATVACADPSDTAISGGVQMIGVGGSNVPVGSSFPGRMDWTTNTPKPNRLDGWIVQFASQDGTAPTKVTVWALCVPGLSVPVTQMFQESAG